MPETQSHVSQILAKHQDGLLQDWLASQAQAAGRRWSASEEKQLAVHSREFLNSLRQGFEHGDDTSSPGWAPVREFLNEVSSSRARSGFSPAQTALFIFSLKEPLFARLRNELEEGKELTTEIVNATLVLDKLGIYTMEAFQRTREEIIVRQQHELLELSTPVVRLWDNVLALPLIGTLDSARTQIVMENLLQAIVDTRSDIAIIDITGVPTVDTLVAQHLLKTIAAARLMGADCIISGIRPQIAQTIIHLGVNLEDVTTKATLADAFALALKRTGHVVTRLSLAPASAAESAR